ncbi:LuxR family transcriptional regulator [soil metagenome]
MVAPWPLVGREVAIAAVDAALEDPSLAGVVLAGPAGTGKTRLAQECLRLGHAAGYATAQVTGSRAAAGIALGALAPLLPAGRLAAGRDVALLTEARDALTALADGRRLLLAVDDAHLLDDPSAVLLHQLALGRAAFVVGTVRNGEMAPEAVTDLWKSGVALRLEVGPLTSDQVDVLLAMVLGGPVDGPTLHRLCRSSDGNVLYLRELVLGALDSGLLAARHGLWRLTGEPGPSARLRDLIADRLGGLSRDELAGLELLAEGAPLALAIVEELCDPAVVEALERRGLVTVECDGRGATVALAHPLHGEVVRAQTPATSVRTIKRRLADAVEAVGTPRDDVLRVVRWRLDGGGDADPDLVRDAALHARFANDLPTAARLAAVAFEARPEFASGYLLSEVLYSLGRSEELAEVLAALDRLVEADDERAMLAAQRAFDLFWHLGEAAAAHQALREGIDQVAVDALRRELDAIASVFLACAGQAKAAVARAEPHLERGGDRAFIQASLAAGLALPLLGRADDAVVVARRGRAACDALGEQLSVFQPSLLAAAETIGLLRGGHLAAAEVAARQGYQRALDESDGAGWAFFAMTRGLVALQQGRITDSGRWWREAADLFGSVGHRGPQRWALAGGLFVAALRGDAVGAARAATELDDTAAHPARMQDVGELRARGWARVAAHDRDGALSELDRAVTTARAAGLAGEELDALHDLARLGRARLVAERVVELAAEVQGVLATVQAAHVAALASNDGAALGAVADGFAALGARVLAAEAAGAAADTLAVSGRARQSTGWRRRARELRASCEGVRTPGLEPAANPVRLSDREREVALLAAGGLPSREIAERLFLSVRTVDNHLARSYTKLGVSGRAELAAALAEPVVSPGE